MAALAAVLTVPFAGYAQLFGGDDTARKQIAEQQKRIDGLRQQHEELVARMARIEESLKNQPVLDLATQFELFRQEVKSLRGQIEVLGNNIDGTAKRQRDMYVDLDTRLRRLEQPAASAPPSSPVPAAPAPAASSAAPAQGAPAAPGDEGRAYEAAQNQRRIGNYQGTIAAFQAFLAQYPKSTLAPRAQYWIGDSYFNLRDFKNAIASQQTLIKTYPESSSVPDALLNIASSQMEMGDTASAKKTLDGLVARFPASEAAEKARRRLATLK
ncbi:MAG: tol-pal system protein YbgF [Pseudomonadota bacterium]